MHNAITTNNKNLNTQQNTPDTQLKKLNTQYNNLNTPFPLKQVKV